VLHLLLSADKNRSRGVSNKRLEPIGLSWRLAGEVGPAVGAPPGVGGPEPRVPQEDNDG
jgi:hypothetical protein